MGYMKSLQIERLETDEVFRLAFEAEEDTRFEPDWPDESESFTPSHSLPFRSCDHEESIHF